jgi:hypothetical protein
MGLLDLQTNLKNYKFGEPPAGDRPGGGNSGQPYIKTPIEDNIVPQSDDFLLRGGLNAPLDANIDVARLTKFFGDLKSPRGVLFVAKQNILSRIATRTQASPTALNEGAYTPLSTLAQAGIGFTGAHVYKQGGNILRTNNPYEGVGKYLSLTRNLIGTINDSSTGAGSSLTDPNNPVVDASSITYNITEQKDNRLVQLTKEKIYNQSVFLSPRNNISKDVGVLLNYGGGPNSSLGVGPTQIRIARDQSGAYLTTIYNNDSTTLYGNKNANFRTWDSSDIGGLGTQLTSDPYRGQIIDGEEISPWKKNDQRSIYQNSTRDFRKTLLEEELKTRNPKSTIMGISPSYQPKNMLTYEGTNGSRVNMTSPGQGGGEKNLINYTAGSGIGPIDKINASKIYEGPVKSDENNDLVKFRIAALDRNGKKTYMHFRAFINSLQDNFNSTWDTISYMGRGEDLYKYSKFTREISIGFTVAAQSREELIPQYKKLNYLASTLAPEYGSSGYMGGVITTLTLGGWFYEQPGFITQLGLSPLDDSPWEIGISAVKNEEGKYIDSEVKELPHIIDVQMSFTPIHRFIPQLQTDKGEGPSRFIALQASENDTNYKS